MFDLKDEEKVRERIFRVVAFQVGKESHEIEPKMHLVKDLGIDSLDSIELALEIEEEFTDDEFELKIPDKETEKLHTVGDIVDYVLSHTKKI